MSAEDKRYDGHACNSCGAPSVEAHCAELVTVARNAYENGERAGVIKGHRIGQAEGYLAGHAEGVRSTDVYRVAAADMYAAGYVDRIGDERATREVAA